MFFFNLIKPCGSDAYHNMLYSSGIQFISTSLLYYTFAKLLFVNVQWKLGDIKLVQIIWRFFHRGADNQGFTVCTTYYIALYSKVDMNVFLCILHFICSVLIVPLSSQLKNSGRVAIIPISHYTAVFSVFGIIFLLITPKYSERAVCVKIYTE